MNFTGKKVLVIGMQSSGMSSCQLLKEKGAIVSCYDDNISPMDSIFKNVRDMEIENIFYKLFLIVLSPGIPNTHPLVIEAKKRKISIISELELGCYFLKTPKILVTGTNGKTTTVCMIERLLTNAGFRCMAMGNIGYPVSQVVLDRRELDYAIIEASSFQLEYVKKIHADISVVLNIAPDHLDRYDTFEDYVSAKKRVLLNQTENDYAVLNYDDVRVRGFAKKIAAKVVWFSQKEVLGEVTIKDKFLLYKEREICHIRASKVRGEHNRYDFLAAMNVGAILNVSRENLYKLYKNYTLLPHRIEYITTIKGKAYYNDSKSTNINSCQNAVMSLDGEIGLIIGGSDKNEDYCDFFENISPKIKHLAVTGSNAEKILSASLKMGFSEIRVTPDLETAVLFLSEQKDINIILFSPSAASFDRYKSYAERGDTFKKIVYEIKA